MDLAILEIFRAVAQERSVTRAAQLLDRVQSNVTTRVKQLEEELGVALFLREGKRMVLTAEGIRFLGYAEKLISLAEEARQSLHPARPVGRLRVGCMESTAASRLPQPLAAFHARWPEVDVAISTATSQQLIDDVRERRLDCALVADPAVVETCGDLEPAGDDGLEWTRIYQEQLLLVLPERHPPVSGPADVNIRTLAGFVRGCTYRQIAENWLAGPERAQDGRLKVLEVNSYHAILACVAAGSCIGILPRSVLELQPAPQVQALPLMQVDTLLVARAGYRTAAYDAFREVLLVSSGGGGHDE